MSADTHARIAAAVRAIADAPPVNPPPPGALRARPARSRSRRAAPAFAAAAVLAIAVVVAVLPAGGTGHRVEMFSDAPATAVLPSEFAGLSPLTAAVSDAPPGTAVALYSQGALGSRRLGTSQILVTGLDGHTYRRLDEAERGGALAPDNEWHAAPSVLSPDGTRVAVGRADDRLAIVDLRSGEATPVGPDTSRSVIPVTWSPDGRRLVFAEEGTSGADIGQLRLLDLATGAVTPLDHTPGPHWTAPFAPDSSSLAVQVASTELVQIVDTGGSEVRRVTLGPRQSLATGPSWSPDGRLLVLIEVDGDRVRIAFADATGTGQAVPRSFGLRGDGLPDLLGWRDAGTMLVGIDDDGGYEIAEVAVDGGAVHVLSRLSHGVLRLARVNALQLATGLVTGVEARDVPGPDRGPWPLWWRIVVGALVLAAGLLAWRVVRGRMAHR